MMTSSNGNISSLLALCVGNSPVTGEFPSQRPVTRYFDGTLTCAWTNSWVNNRDAGDLRRHRTHYGVTAMTRNRIKRSRHEDTFAIRFLSTANRWSNLYDKILIDSEWMIWFLSLGYNLSICIKNHVPRCCDHRPHYSDVITSVMASQITGVSIVYSTVCSGAENIKALRH